MLLGGFVIFGIIGTLCLLCDCRHVGEPGRKELLHADAQLECIFPSTVHGLYQPCTVHRTPHSLRAGRSHIDG